MSDERPHGTALEGSSLGWFDRISQLLNNNPRDRQGVRDFLRLSHDLGLLDLESYRMIEGVMEVAESQVRDVMIPRSQMIVVKRDDDLEKFLPTLIESGHSRFPVIGEQLDEVFGILMAKDLLPYLAFDRRDQFNIRELLRTPMFVPETKSLNTLLTEFRTSRNHLAVVVDEYGGVAGLVTLEDVLEEIVGDIADEYDVEDEEIDITPLGEGAYAVCALTPVGDFNDFFHMNFSDEESVTIGGVVVQAFEHLPKKGEQIVLGGLLVTVLKADGRRVQRLRVEPLPAALPEDPITS